MHRLICPKSPDWDIVDHINIEKLDNRLANLRRASGSLNAHNRHKFSTNPSTPYVGVTLIKRKKKDKFRATVSKDGKDYNAGRYDSPTVAAWARDQYAKVLYGPGAYQNKVPQPDGWTFCSATLRAIRVNPSPLSSDDAQIAETIEEDTEEEQDDRPSKRQRIV